MANKERTDTARMEKIVSLCKRRGFIFQAGEIYGGLNGCWDYGPLGAELKRNLKDYWWRKTVQERDDVLGMDGAILTMEQVLISSGHVGGFSDPMCDCLLSKVRMRADQVPSLTGAVYHFSGATLPDSSWKSEKAYSVMKLEGMDEAKLRKTAREYYSQFFNDAIVDKKASLKAIELTGERTESLENTTSYNPENGSLLTEPRQFNLMLQTNFGATGEQIAYLRPETAQSIFCQYKNVLDSNRIKLPFGIAQCGKSFRNEINPRNFTFRSREFEQMEIEYFCHPDDGMRLTDEWLAERLAFYEAIGIPRHKLHILDVPDGERAFYSKKTYDIEYEFPFGVQELEGVAYRTDYDLGVHAKGSNKPLEYFDEETKQRFIPHVVEPSAGCDRTILALICEAYDEEVITDENGKEDVRTVLRFKPSMAPVKVGIFPMLKKNEQQVAIAKQIQKTLQPWMMCFYDDGGALGRRYRRQDEVGTPFCITVDFESLGENDSPLKDTVTIRHRDSMQQERIAISELLAWLLPRVR
ncbi:MAG: glycine--tRNA ligase [Verrucomicrobia bacterium]|nr:MAG: glycine--tRNA ligase [Verrucomicrobiota bacterium]